MDEGNGGARASERGWRDAYGRLRDYAAAHEGIRLAPRSLTVPPEARPGFYELVEQVQGGLAEAVLGSEAERVREAARRCAAMRGRVLDRSGLAAFHLAPTLESLMSDADKTLAKPAFALVLDAVGQGSSPEELEAAARRALPPFCSSLFRNAYEAWAYLGVVAALEPTRFYATLSSDTEEVRAVRTDEVRAASQVTSPERRIPEAVFETADGRVFAMKSEAARELDYYGVRIERRRDSSAGGNTAGLMGHRVLLLYRLGSVDDVAVTVDRQKRVQTPIDLMCEVLEPHDMSYPAYVSAFVERINAARSRRPVQVITFDASGEFAPGLLDDEAVAPVRRRTVGFDEEKLADIAKTLDDRDIDENPLETEEP